MENMQILNYSRPMADDLEKRLKAMELAVHSQTIAMRHLAQDVRDLSEVMQEIAYKLRAIG
jgi:uncharacterized coiled-coil protein SlyX